MLPRGADDLRLQLGHFAETDERDDVRVGDDGGDERSAALAQFLGETRRTREREALDVREGVPRAIAPLELAKELREEHGGAGAEAVPDDREFEPRVGRRRGGEVVSGVFRQPPRRAEETRVRVAEHGDAVRADGVVRARMSGERGDGVADGVRAADDEEETTLDAVAD